LLQHGFGSAALLIMLGVALTDAAFAQSTVQGVPNAMQGFSVNREQPIQIEATTLEVRDKESVATFSGNVHVIQGDTHLRTTRLVVFYDQEGGKQPAKPNAPKSANAPRSAKAATPGPAGQQSIRRLEALGGVHVTQKDQVATGDKAIFETRTNSVTLDGNVTLTQGPNVLQGDRLIVDLTTGVSRVVSDSGRVRATFQSASPPPVPQTPGRDAPRQPMSLR
jgi:lipopolysaccharide export system protein LptA